MLDNKLDKTILYETTNELNGKYYIGVHKVIGKENYFGSGTILKKAITKYGPDNFFRETLMEFDNETDAYEAEKEIVNIDMVKNKNSYNIMLGGGNPPTLRGKDHPWYGSGKNHPLCGFKHTEEFKESRRIANTGEGNPNYGKKGKDSHAAKLWYINGKLFYTSKEAADFFGVHRSTINRWCNPKSNCHTPLCYKRTKPKAQSIPQASTHDDNKGQ